MAYLNGSVRRASSRRPLPSASRRAGALLVEAPVQGALPLVAGGWDEALAVLAAAGSAVSVHVTARAEMSAEECAAWLTLLRRSYALLLALRRGG